MTLRYFVYLAYKGTNYHGWQIQPNANTVQAEINKALQTILPEKTTAVGSGRTDTGVHATGQVFHCDLPASYRAERLARKLNGVLPDDIVVDKVVPVVAEAHARYSALSRRYAYRLRFSKSPFSANEYYYLPKKPDFAVMNRACVLIMGTHEFTSFSRVKTSVNNFICEVTEARWQDDGDQAVFYITANRFLRGMVRALTGTLLAVGFGKLSLDEFAAIIEAKDRRRAGQSVPPQGLYLCEVRYPEELFIN